jgi:hypothetical protein
MGGAGGSDASCDLVLLVDMPLEPRGAPSRGSQRRRAEQQRRCCGDEAAIVAGHSHGRAAVGAAAACGLLSGSAFTAQTSCSLRSTIVRLRVPVGSALGRRLRECTLELFV